MLEGYQTDVLYYVLAQASPDSDDLEPIGEIKMKGPFHGSKYGDKSLFFQHTRMEDDFKIHPEWVKGAQAQLEKEIKMVVHDDLPFDK